MKNIKNLFKKNNKFKSLEYLVEKCDFCGGNKFVL